jgi:hypothetical protein
MNEKYNYCEIGFHCKAGMDQSRCKFSTGADECKWYNYGSCRNKEAKREALKAETKND